MQGFSGASWPWYRSGIKPLLEWKAIASAPLDAITSETAAAYAAHRTANGLQPGTINRELPVLRRLLRLATEWGAMERAPKVTLIRGERRRERVVGDEEFERYLVCATPVLAEVATVLFEMGLRPDECHRLAWSDIASRTDAMAR